MFSFGDRRFVDSLDEPRELAIRLKQVRLQRTLSAITLPVIVLVLWWLMQRRDRPVDTVPLVMLIVLWGVLFEGLTTRVRVLMLMQRLREHRD